MRCGCSSNVFRIQQHPCRLDLCSLRRDALGPFGKNNDPSVELTKKVGPKKLKEYRRQQTRYVVDRKLDLLRVFPLEHLLIVQKSGDASSAEGSYACRYPRKEAPGGMPKAPCFVRFPTNKQGIGHTPRPDPLLQGSEL